MAVLSIERGGYPYRDVHTHATYAGGLDLTKPNRSMNRRQFMRLIGTGASGLTLAAIERQEAASLLPRAHAHSMNLRDNRTPETIRFAAIGDYGSKKSGTHRVANLVKGWQPDFIITLGDNNYEKGARSTIDRNVGYYFRDYIYPYVGEYEVEGSGEEASVNRFFPALGNHDWSGLKWNENGLRGAYLSYFDLPGNKRYYDFVQGSVHFFVIDSDYHEPDGVSGISNQAMWLRAALADSAARWKIVYFHHSPYSSGKMNGSNPVMRWPFKQWGAHAVLSGHDHLYERLVIDDFPYFVNGLGGKSRHEFREPLVGSQRRYSANDGAIYIEATSERLTFQFITVDDELIDSYTIQATVPPEGDDVPPEGASEVANVEPAHVEQRFAQRIFQPNDLAEETLHDGIVSATATGLGLADNANGHHRLIGVRFPDVIIPHCATITSATIEFTAAELCTAPSALTIHGEAAGNARPLTNTSHNLSQRLLTHTMVPWSDIPSWTSVGEAHDTPDLSAIVQEIVNRDDWYSGNAIAFMISGSGHRRAASYAQQPVVAPCLHITYTLGAGESTANIEVGKPSDETQFAQRLYLPTIAAEHCR